MKNLFEKNEVFSDLGGLQDNIFLIGIFLFLAVLVLGLFPVEESTLILGEDSLLPSAMTIPVIAAIYLIFVTFSRSYYSQKNNRTYSIRYKIGLALIFVATVPLLLTIFALNNFIKNTFDDLLSKQTEKIWQENILMVNEESSLLYNRVQGELKFIKNSLGQNIFSLEDAHSRKKLLEFYRDKKFNLFICTLENNSWQLFKGADHSAYSKFSEVKNFLEITPQGKEFRIDKVYLDSQEVLLGLLPFNNFLIILYDQISPAYNERVKLFNSSREEYEKAKQLVYNFKEGYRLYLLFISIIIIIISVSISFFLSKNITKPILELLGAVKELSLGNFKIRLKRSSRDEISILFNAFNLMIKELEKNRKVLYEKQKLEAWREIARMLVHEIKNPLTPILLSAERIRKKADEKKSILQETVISGTETIIEEVKVLMEILAEFTKFARLPEMKLVKTKIEPILENSYQAFSNQSKVKLHLDLEKNLPILMIDKIFIHQAINNIILNSLEAIKEKGNIYLKAFLVQEDHKKIVRITISDDGVGIKKNDLNKIFELGFSTKSSGMGLGLAIVKKIIMEHHGKIYCDYEYEHGTKFVIDFYMLVDEENNG